MDDLDRRILDLLQRDASLSVETVASRVHSSKSPVWNRIRKMRDKGIIAAQVAVLDPQKVDRGEVFFVSVKTGSHSADWLSRFTDAIRDLPEIQEAHRLAGEIDYILKVRVRDTRAFDAFYKRLTARVEMFAVTSQLSMETIKSTTVIDLSEPDAR